LLLACDGPNGKVDPVSVQWMDWPAEVNAGQPFRTRLVVWGVCAINPRFRPGAHADQLAVTFAPYYLVDNDQIFCANLREVTLLQVGAIDTSGTAPGLAASASRTYEMRAGAEVVFARAEESIPVRHFATSSCADRRRSLTAQRRRHRVPARGFVGCLRLSPLGLYNPNSALVLEDQADTTGLNYAFVRGYIHEAAAPVCGQTRVFHLVSRN